MPRTIIRLGNVNRAFDARPDRLDLRDRTYLPHLTNLHRPREWPADPILAKWLPAYATMGLILDQGSDGACTGFGLAAVVNFLLFKSEIEQGPAARRPRRTRQVSSAMLYELARLYDEWPGEDYEGSSCRGALKGWQRHGVCSARLWPYSVDAKGKRVPAGPIEDRARRDDATRNWDVDALETSLGAYFRIDVRSVVDMQSAIRDTGAVYVSATVHEGWDVVSKKPIRRHDDLARIKATPSPKQPGGHAFALVGYNELGFVVQNSWGKSWGSSGFALLPYEDWVTHGDDAWVMALGMSRQRALAEKGVVPRTTRHYVPVTEVGESSDGRTVGLPAGSDGLTRRFENVPAEVRPLTPDQAYRHTLVLDRGFPVKNDIAAPDAMSAVDRVGFDDPLEWLQRRKSRKLVIFAHGGLNSEQASISRVRVMSPYWTKQDVYPLYITWRSGALETISDIVEEFAAKLGLGKGAAPARGWVDAITEKTDGLLESVLRPVGCALWTQMRINAERASDHAEGGVRRLVDALNRLAQARPGLEIHLVGHSAGSIILGSMLSRFTAVGLKAASVRLYAPACTLRFTLDRYLPAIQSGTLAANRWTTHYLSEQNERDDSVGPYRKSLLYLVSRAFEEAHKTPLLGMQKAFEQTVKLTQQDNAWSRDAAADFAAWAAFRKAQGAGLKSVPLTKRSVSNGKKDIGATHGCFDNTPSVVGPTIDAIRDGQGASSAVGMRLDY